MSLDGFFERYSRWHPLKTMITVIIFGITMLFLGLLVLFAYNNPARHLGGQHFPKLFFFSTFTILLCSYTMERARYSFKWEHPQRLRGWLLITLLLSGGFSAMQYEGWHQLWHSGITLYAVHRDTPLPPETPERSGSLSDYAAQHGPTATAPREKPSKLDRTPSGAFLYVISGLHLAHLGGGLIFLLLFIFKTLRAAREPVNAMVFFTNPVESVRMEMIAKYWHYLGGLWIVLFLYFLWFFV